MSYLRPFPLLRLDIPIPFANIFAYILCKACIGTQVYCIEAYELHPAVSFTSRYKKAPHSSKKLSTLPRSLLNGLLTHHYTSFVSALLLLIIMKNFIGFGIGFATSFATFSVATTTSRRPFPELKVKRQFLTCFETYGRGSITCGAEDSHFCYNPDLGEVSISQRDLVFLISNDCIRVAASWITDTANLEIFVLLLLDSAATM